MSTWEDEYEEFCESDEEDDDEEEDCDYDPDDYEEGRYSFEAFDPLSQSTVVYRN